MDPFGGSRNDNSEKREKMVQAADRPATARRNKDHFANRSMRAEFSLQNLRSRRFNFKPIGGRNLFRAVATATAIATAIHHRATRAELFDAVAIILPIK
jgi:hypothetical protein